MMHRTCDASGEAGGLRHIPVMLREVEEALRLKPGMAAVDCTLGLGGHAARIAELIGAEGWLTGIDQDMEAIHVARERLAGFEGRLDIIHGNFSDILTGLATGPGIDAVLFDLGVSSLQLDSPERGFSFRTDGPLDMRMNAGAGPSAEDIVNSMPEKDLADLIFNYGEERFARRIARHIVSARSRGRITRTAALADIVLRSLPRGYQRDKLHPATRTFQALRIAVNRELEVLSGAVDQAFMRLKPGGRLAAISFHSLEDRIIKETFKRLFREGEGLIITKKPLRPSDDEAAGNPRARSARLRVIERKDRDVAFS
jgi:16S rRNA (cytosine1402-N4)-methyltransferase